MIRIKKPARNEEKEDNAKEKLEKSSFGEELPLTAESATEIKEKREELKPEEMQEIRKRMEKTEIDDSLKTQAEEQAKTMRNLAEEEKIKKLLDLTKLKGVIYSVNVAKKMDDPYVLDLLHDILAKEGYYKEFTK